MKTFKLQFAGLLVSLASTACDDPASPVPEQPGPDASTSHVPDTGVVPTGKPDAGKADAAPSGDDAGPVGEAGASPDGNDASAPDAGELDAQLTDGGSTFDGSCASLPGTHVTIESGDTQESLLKNLGRHLRDNKDITLVFNLTGSCTLINDIYTGVRIVPSGMMKYVPSTEEDPDWTPSMPAPTCTTGPEGAAIDIAISALFAESCALGGPPADSNLKLFQGPVQAYTFVVPSASDQDAIWAEEAYYAFGFGAENPLATDYNPWNKEEFMFIRPPTKSTLVATAKNIHLPPASWKGSAQMASTDVVNSVVNSTDPDATIGILGAEVYDNNRDKGLKTLAFQAFDQSAAYYPDSSSSAFDKQNVRDGHYTLWSPTVYITEVDNNDQPTQAAVATVLSQVLGTSAQLEAGAGFDGLADVVKVGLVPDCAMQVTRSEDGGDLSPYAPAAPCTCFYLSHIPGSDGAPDGCVACEDDGDCSDAGSGLCSHGFCEPMQRTPSELDAAACFGGVPSDHAELINACTDAQSIVKDVVLPGAELLPLP